MVVFYLSRFMLPFDIKVCASCFPQKRGGDVLQISIRGCVGPTPLTGCWATSCDWLTNLSIRQIAGAQWQRSAFRFPGAAEHELCIDWSNFQGPNSTSCEGSEVLCNPSLTPPPLPPLSFSSFIYYTTKVKWLQSCQDIVCKSLSSKTLIASTCFSAIYMCWLHSRCFHVITGK